MEINLAGLIDDVITHLAGRECAVYIGTPPAWARRFEHGAMRVGDGGRPEVWIDLRDGLTANVVAVVAHEAAHVRKHLPQMSAHRAAPSKRNTPMITGPLADELAGLVVGYREIEAGTLSLEWLLYAKTHALGDSPLAQLLALGNVPISKPATFTAHPSNKMLWMKRR